MTHELEVRTAPFGRSPVCLCRFERLPRKSNQQVLRIEIPFTCTLLLLSLQESLLEAFVSGTRSPLKLNVARCGSEQLSKVQQTVNQGIFLPFGKQKRFGRGASTNKLSPPKPVIPCALAFLAPLLPNCVLVPRTHGCQSKDLLTPNGDTPQCSEVGSSKGRATARCSFELLFGSVFVDCCFSVFGECHLQSRLE